MYYAMYQRQCLEYKGEYGLINTSHNNGMIIKKQWQKMSHKELFDIFSGKTKRKLSDPSDKDPVPSKQKVEELVPPAPVEPSTDQPHSHLDPMQMLEEEKSHVKAEVKADSSSDEEIEEKEPEFMVLTSNIQGCQHECVLPKGFKRKDRDPTRTMAKEYKFNLDPFQQASIDCLERNESVLVAAHTSAGKTVVAEYAIAMALKNHQRVIYTSPIKALSNQKYREFSQEFDDVGLMTGDVTLNPNASCIVMTTEILRNMLYKGSEVVREMAWVVFDEIHYMRDKERGVVWEETIILVPSAVKYVFLSATIQNAREFAQWIAKIKMQPCNVVYTDFRPVPLQHYIYPKGADGIYLVVDEKGEFKEKKFNEAIAQLEKDEEITSILGKGKRKDKKTAASEIKKVVQLIVDQKLDPCIVFSFSKDECEKHVLSLAGLDLTTAEEKEAIEKIYNNAIATLSEEDQQLKMIKSMLPLLKKGLGIHHGGLLPILKEVIEILFQECFIKVIFTTETFSMGINMPARTVVFTSIEKFDGETFRWIGGGEYIQMSGRAGRRGIDDKGTCILIADKRMDTDVAKGILKGQPDPLYSSFYLSYNMLLNMQRIEDMDPAYLITRSFYQFQRDQALPRKRKELRELKLKLQLLDFPEAKNVSHYLKIQEEIKRINSEANKMIFTPQNVLPYLAAGRLVHIADETTDWGWGIVVNFTRKRIIPRGRIQDLMPGTKPDENGVTQLREESVILDVVLYVQKKLTHENTVQPASVELHNGTLSTIPVMLQMVCELSKIKMKMLPNLKDPDNVAKTERLYLELMKRFNFQLPLMDPVTDMEIDDPNLRTLIERRKVLEEKIKGQSIAKFSPDEIQRFEEMKAVKERVKELKGELRKGKKMVLYEELKSMQRVLRRLEFCDKNSIQTKGKVACEISAGDELLATEMLFRGIFNTMKPAVIAAVLSSLIYTERKSDAKLTKNEDLQAGFTQMREIAEKIGKIRTEINPQQTLDEYVNQFKPDMMEITHQWCNGANFGEICKMTEIYEGTIIRCFKRLDELIKELIDAAKVIGNTQIVGKMGEIAKNMRRDIVFAASLYLQTS
eukprot:TRINITY_DN1916_c0_g1_i1.p1 TRINITY_DN1916_c0_g1~~TRINITY_DN1916_c0_g1_i1.p1  ORF type:complete len:1081 (+),score=160.85 TRINITY_DN1916_c0_g1_i1:7764-11006(+)